MNKLNLHLPAVALSRSGWKGLAVLNVYGSALLSTLLVVLLIVSASKTKSIQGNWLFAQASCSDTPKILLALHLLINIVSTIVLGASSFFMQILNAPTQSETKRAHARFKRLDIGVPSPRNMIHMPKTKTAVWICLALTSLPLHLLANATIFMTEYGRDKFYVGVASEAFLDGADYYPPGASLNTYDSGIESWRWEEVDPTADPAIYQDPSSEHITHIHKLATVAAGNWTRLERDECIHIYFYSAYNPLREHGDLLIIAGVDADADGNVDDDATGWIPSRYWNASSTENGTLPGPTLEEVFEGTVPFDQPNSLWVAGWGSVGTNQGLISRMYSEPTVLVWEYHPPDDVISYRVNNDSRAELIPIRYCLSEPTPQLGFCSLGMSNTILLVVSLAVVLKTALYASTVRMESKEPLLITLGDAVTFFLDSPDPETAGMGTFGHRDIKQLQKTKSDQPFPSSISPQPPRAWKNTPRRWASAIGIPLQVAAYGFFAVCISITIYLFKLVEVPRASIGAFGPSLENDYIGFDHQRGLLPCVLLANAPQVVLAVYYLLYNGLYTRMLMAKEWTELGASTGKLVFHGLRVTDPKGECQVSTHRLQMPYRYAVPVLTTSAVMHWMASNCIYVVVGLGDYWDDYLPSSSSASRQGTAESGLESAVFAVGYSTRALVPTACVAAAFMLVPMLRSLRKLPGNGAGPPVVGSNSLAISAACHYRDIAARRGDVSYGGSRTSEDEELLGTAGGEKVSQRRVRWGVVKQPGEEDGAVVPGRLGFGPEGTTVERPVEGGVYA